MGKAKQLMEVSKKLESARIDFQQLRERYVKFLEEFSDLPSRGRAVRGFLDFLARKIPLTEEEKNLFDEDCRRTQEQEGTLFSTLFDKK